jgi:hypothetical protein
VNLPAPHREALGIICARLPLATVDWALTGSVGHRLQGVDVPVHDIDVQTDEGGASAVGAALAEYVVEAPEPRTSPLIRSVFGRFLVAGVEVELMGGMCHRRSPDAPWGAPVDPADHRRVVRYAGLDVPVLDLAHEADAYDLMGRHERAALLRRSLRR